MNKSDLVEEVASQAGLQKASAARAVDACFDAIAKSLSRGDEVRVVNFGTFSVAHRKAKDGRNPQTGEKIRIPASKNPRFKPGKFLKESVN